MRKMRILLLVAVISFAAFSCAFCEEKRPEFPPLSNWDDVIDVTDCVLSWEGEYAIKEEYTLFEQIPTFPNPHSHCKAPKGYDSFAGGRKMPAQYNTDIKHLEQPGFRYYPIYKELIEVAPKPGTRDVFNVVPNAPKFKMPYVLSFDRRYRYARDIRASEVIERIIISTVKYPNKLYKVVLDIQHFLLIDCREGDQIGIATVIEAKDLKVSDEGNITERIIPELTGTEFLCGYDWGRGHQTKGCAVFITADGKHLKVAHADGSFRELPFDFKEVLGAGIWNALPYYSDSRRSSVFQYPYLQMCERNFGHKRGGKCPSDSVTLGGFREVPNPESCKWMDENRIRPEVHRSRMAIFNLETGEKLFDEVDIFDLWYFGDGVFVYPNVAYKGMWNLAVLKDGKLANLISYSSMIPTDAIRISQYDNRLVCEGLSTCATVDFDSHKMTRLNYIHPRDLKTHQRVSEDSVYLSAPFDYNGTQARLLHWEIDEGRYNTVIIKDILKPDISPCGVYGIRECGVFIFDGERYCRIRADKEEK